MINTFSRFNNKLALILKNDIDNDNKTTKDKKLQKS
jgi:hypothetical protein